MQELQRTFAGIQITPQIEGEQQSVPEGKDPKANAAANYDCAAANCKLRAQSCGYTIDRTSEAGRIIYKGRVETN